MHKHLGVISAAVRIYTYFYSTFSRHIPTIVVQGRYDVVCPVSFWYNNKETLNEPSPSQATTAYALKKVVEALIFSYCNV